MSSAQFPSLPGLTWNITRTPRFSTKVQQSVGGRRIVAAFQPYPIWRWTLEFEFLRSAAAYTEWQQLMNFFTARQGSFDTFLFDDPEDDSVTDMPFGTGDGSTVAFQLKRTLVSGGLSEPIYNLKASPVPVIKDNGVTKSTPGDYSISSSGLVTFTSPVTLGHTLTWTGGYYWRVAFEQDVSEFQMFAQHFWKNRQVSFLSILGA